MGSPERKISAGPPAPEPAAGVEARLASLEAEAARLRAEVAALQDDLRWLGGEEEDGNGDPAFLSRGWLGAGWVRASLLLTTVGLVAIVSVPYFLHLLDPSGRPADPAPVQAAESVPAAPVTRVARPAAREYVPAPTRVRSTEIPAPVRVATDERLIAPPPRAARRARPAPVAPADLPSGPAPSRTEGP
jgi:hypothetical protein